jgi:hypothetical protein
VDGPDLNRVLVAFLGAPGSAGGADRVEAIVGAASASQAIAACEEVVDSISQVPDILYATWPPDRIIDLASEVAFASFPALSQEALAALRSRWAYDLR